MRVSCWRLKKSVDCNIEDQNDSEQSDYYDDKIQSEMENDVESESEFGFSAVNNAVFAILILLIKEIEETEQEARAAWRSSWTWQLRE